MKAKSKIKKQTTILSIRLEVFLKDKFKDTTKRNGSNPNREVVRGIKEYLGVK